MTETKQKIKKRIDEIEAELSEVRSRPGTDPQIITRLLGALDEACSLEETLNEIVEMTIRQQFVMAAMQGLLASGDANFNYNAFCDCGHDNDLFEDFAQHIIKIVDACLEQEMKTREEK